MIAWKLYAAEKNLNPDFEVRNSTSLNTGFIFGNENTT